MQNDQAAAGAFAQDVQERAPRKTPQERAKIRTEHMTTELGLSTEQATRVEALNLKYGEEAMTMRAQHDTERDSRREQFKGRREAYDADLKAVLTPEQYTTWQAKKEEMKAKHIEKRTEMRGERK